jgi:WASH complex subunit 7
MLQFRSQIKSFLYRAVKFNRGIRKLGLMADGVSSYLDQFRLLITHIGNALGLVRMVRSGGRLQAAATVRFVPEVGLTPDFAQLAAAEVAATPPSEGGQPPPGIETAAMMTDTYLSSLVEGFSGGNPYYSLLVRVFAGQLSGGGPAGHLALFYLMLPPLAVNYVEYLMAAKERLARNNIEGATGGAVFSEDGFALGLAFCLEVLGQWRQLDSLHWSDSVRDFLDQERRKVAASAAKTAAAASGGPADNESATQALTLRRLEATVREFQLLNFSLASARIFFQVKNNECFSTSVLKEGGGIPVG